MSTLEPSPPPDWRTGILADVIRIVVESALEAELIEHLDRPLGPRPGGAGRDNARNGYRSKTVRTAFGAVVIDAPRDRWGTFQPIAVGKWQRRVVGVDQIAVPLAARGADRSECVALLSRVYRPPVVSMGLAGLVAAGIARNMLAWHLRPLRQAYESVTFDRVIVRSRDGGIACTPVRTAVGVTQDDRRALLTLHAAPSWDSLVGWRETVTDLRDRGVSAVESVVCPAVPDLDAVVNGVWPSAVRLERAA